MHISASPSEVSSITLSGDWVLDNLSAIEVELKKLPHEKTISLNAEIGKLDTAGAYLLSTLTANKKTAIKGLEAWQLSLLQLVEKTHKDYPGNKSSVSLIVQALSSLGEKAFLAWDNIVDLLNFIGETTATLWNVIKNPKRFRLSSIMRHIRETGLAAVPIVSLIAFLISIVLAYQGVNQLRRFGADIFTIDLVAVSVLREMGVLLTAIMIAGRSGSAFTAEIGVMKVNEEVDAMRIIGINPFEVLVLPRLLALVITLPLLTFIANIMGLIGGGIVSYSLINVGFDQYLDRFHDAASLNDFLVGMIKAPVFAFFIAVVGCMRGMQVTGSAESVGRLTTTSVVQSIFLVLLLDALFSIFFTKVGM